MASQKRKRVACDLGAETTSWEGTLCEVCVEQLSSSCGCLAGEARRDARKIGFVIGALSGEDPFARDDGLPSIIMDNIAWAAENSDEQIIAERERVTSEIESLGADLWNSGRCDEWLQGVGVIGRNASR